MLRRERYPDRATRMSRIGGAPTPSGPRSAADRGYPGRGTRVAWPSLVSVATAVTLSGCIITQPVHFDEPPNSPPAIYDASPIPMPALNAVLQLVPVAIDDAGMQRIPTQTFEVVVFDADVDQSLQFQVLVDRAPCRACVGMNGILSPSPRVSDRARRRLTFNVDWSLLATSRCHSVELLVSGQFIAGSQSPIEDGDLASATWWVASSDGTTVDMRDCR